MKVSEGSSLSGIASAQSVPAVPERPAKLVCSALWKIYGPKADSRRRQARQRTDDLDALAGTGGHLAAVREVSFEVRAGEIFVLMGLSGSGKSTVLRCLSRLVEPTAGSILLDGVDLLSLSPAALIELRRHKMGMVFQHFGLLPHLTVFDNVAYPLRVQGVAPAVRTARARAMLELVGLDGRELSFPRELSGGQQQRVGIARSLAADPDIWLLDEPFSALDPLIRRQMQDEFLRLQRLMNKTIVFVTHDFLEALRIADRVAIMRDGRIVQLGTPADLVLRPSDPYVAEFTRDVPRERVLTAADIARPVEVSAPGAATIPRSAPLRDVIAALAAGPEALLVVDQAGGVVGEVTPAVLLQALAGVPTGRRQT